MTDAKKVAIKATEAEVLKAHECEVKKAQCEALKAEKVHEVEKAQCEAKKVEVKKVAEAKKLTDAKKEEVKASFAEVHKVTIKTNERAILEAHFVDDFGNASPVREDAVWTSSDEAIVACVACEDKSLCDVRPGGKLGTATVVVTAVGDKEISNKFDVTVIPSALATQIGIVVKVVEVWQK